MFVGMCSVFALCDGRGRTIVGERGGAFRRVVARGRGGEAPELWPAASVRH